MNNILYIIAFIVIIIITINGLKIFDRTTHHKKYYKASRYFIKRINEGFRVYDCCFPISGYPYMDWSSQKFSILSKKVITVKNAQILFPCEMIDIKIIKNVNAKYCKYITFDGKSVYRFRNRTGHVYKTNRVKSDCLDDFNGKKKWIVLTMKKH